MPTHSYLPVSNGSAAQSGGGGLGAYGYGLLTRLTRRRQALLLVLLFVALSGVFWVPHVSEYTVDHLRVYPLGGWRPGGPPAAPPLPVDLGPEPDLSLTYDTPPTPWSDQYVLDSSAFPPPYAQGKPHVYAAGSNPHLGEIPPHLLAILQAEPSMKPPPRPQRAEFEPPSGSHTPWTRATNGSASRAADAMSPHVQSPDADWRSGKYAGWAPPLAALSAHIESGLKKPLPKVQFAFQAPERHTGKRGDEKRERLIRERQRLVKNAFLHSWNGYKAYAWGHDELKPVSKRPNDNFNGWGATIVDALDTLLVLGLPGEYDLARQHVRDIDFHLVASGISSDTDGTVPIFETAIRYLGGLLAAYDLSGDEVMRDRAEELGQLLLPAFETHSGIPLGRMRPGAPAEKSSAGRAILAEAGSMLLEMTRLWQVTGNRTYFDRVQRTTDWLDHNMTMGGGRPGNLLPIFIYPESGSASGTYTFGGMADSYYEYLIKEHQLLGGALQYGRMYADSIDSARKWLMRTIGVISNAPSLMTLGQANGRHFQPMLEHLTCFSGGMLGLGSKLLSRSADLTAARRFTETCWWTYNSSTTGIGPEEVMFYRADDTDRFEFEAETDGTMHKGKPRGNPIEGVRHLTGEYKNRPETIESVLYMWRITGDPVWQERGWQMFASWVTHCMTDAGFSSISDVMEVPVHQTDSMESYSFAETFKYYYLLFSPPNMLSLDDWVFTTEAHPLRLPKNGAWGQPKAGEFWHASATHVPVDDPEVYAGGELGPAGGLTNWQKQIVGASLARKKQREKERQK